MPHHNSIENGGPENESHEHPDDHAKKAVLFFDIDNTLYSKTCRIHEIMAVYIREFVARELDLPEEDAEKLHQTYYKDYGLAIEGLVRHNKVDAMEYNAKVDNRLPLEEILRPAPELHHLLRHVDRSRIKTWLFTNAYITHGQRVVNILGLKHDFEGITYCDYSQRPLMCKPMPQMFLKAMLDAGLGPEDHHLCYFVDDSVINVEAARKLGWKAVRLDEDLDESTPPPPGTIRTLLELPVVFPELFKPDPKTTSSAEEVS